MGARLGRPMSVGQSLLALLLFTPLPLTSAGTAISRQQIGYVASIGTTQSTRASGLNLPTSLNPLRCCGPNHKTLRSHFMTQSLFCRYSSLLEGVAGVTSLKKANRTDGQALETTKFCRSTCVS